MKKMLMIALVLVATLSGFDAVEKPLEIIDLPDTISRERVEELVKGTLNGREAEVRVKFVDQIDDEVYTSGTARKDGTVEIRNSLTKAGIEATLIHEVAHVLTRGHSHGQVWCDTHLEASSRLLDAEQHERQIRQLTKRYACDAE